MGLNALLHEHVVFSVNVAGTDQSLVREAAGTLQWLHTGAECMRKFALREQRCPRLSCSGAISSIFFATRKNVVCLGKVAVNIRTARCTRSPALTPSALQWRRAVLFALTEGFFGGFLPSWADGIGAPHSSRGQRG